MILLFVNIFLNITSFLVFLLCIILAYYKYSFGYWSRKDVPQIPPKFPFGNIKNFILQEESLGESFQTLYHTFKEQGHRFGGIYFLFNPQLLLVDPDLIKSILAKDFQYFSHRGIKINVKKEPLSEHLLNLSGHKWKNMRQKLTPTFTSAKMKMMFNTLLECSAGLEEILDVYVKNKEDIDVKELFGRFGTDVIGSCAFGLDCNSIKNPDSEFRKYGKRNVTPTASNLIKRIINRISPTLFILLNLRQGDKELSNFFFKVIADTIEYREKNKIIRNDFLQLLINIKNTGNVDADNVKIEDKNVDFGMNINEIAAQSFIFFLAGFETSSTTMSFFLYDMGVHQEIQDKVRGEINEMLNRYDGKLTYDGIMELKYLDQVLCESMRIHSSIPFVYRLCTMDYKIPNTDVVIKKGTSVVVPFIGVQSDPEYYPEPTKYNPDRFNDEENAKRHPFTFLPFGEGPRKCIGQRFGLLQTKVGLIVLLKNHRFTISKRTKLPLKIDPKSVIFSIFGGIWMNAERI